MPHTYPSPKVGRQNDPRNPHPHYKPTLTHRSPTTQGLPPSPSSRYLTPIQEQRILSWRDNAAPSHVSHGSHALQPKIKSAPASLAFSRTTPTGSSTYSRCPICADVSSCSCTSAQYAQAGVKPPRRHRGYYKKSKNHSGLTISTPAPVTPRDLPYRETPRIASASRSPSYSGVDQGRRSTPRPDAKGMPSIDQVQAYTSGAAPPAQYGPAPTIPLPEPKTVPPPDAAAAPAPPRIAGVRDPVSQN